MKKHCVLLGLLLLLATGCSQRMVDYTVISTRNIDWSRANSLTRGKSRVFGKDTIHIIFFIPTGVPNMEEAIDRAIDKVPGCVALVDGVLYHKNFYIPLLYGQSWYVIEGSPLIDPALAGDPAPEMDDMAIFCDAKGEVTKITQLSPSDYEDLKGKLR